MRCVFVYGSLLSTESRGRSVMGESALEPAFLFGFRRSFELPSTTRFEDDGSPACVLNLIPGEKDARVNGGVVRVSEEDFCRVLEREGAYELVPVTYSVSMEGGSFFKAEAFIAKKRAAHPYRLHSSVQKEYLGECLTGCRELGAQHVSLFWQSTNFPTLTRKEYQQLRHSYATGKASFFS